MEKQRGLSRLDVLEAKSINARAKSDVLRFITCGSVDDGKSTLIDRLLYESRPIFREQLTRVAADGKRQGTLVDGLQAEREQGVTIDVAYRTFSTDKRSFIVADTPGYEQYTRNMATGAWTADLAIVLIDARRGDPGGPPSYQYPLPPRHPSRDPGDQQDGPRSVVPYRPRRDRRGLS